MSERFDFNACWKECMKRAYLPDGIIATDKYEIKDNAEAFFNLGANYKNRDKEIDQLKAKLDKATKALEFYADDDSYGLDGSINVGDKARETLKEIRGEK